MTNCCLVMTHLPGEQLSFVQPTWLKVWSVTAETCNIFCTCKDRPRMGVCMGYVDIRLHTNRPNAYITQDSTILTSWFARNSKTWGITGVSIRRWPGIAQTPFLQLIDILILQLVHTHQGEVLLIPSEVDPLSRSPPWAAVWGFEDWVSST